MLQTVLKINHILFIINHGIFLWDEALNTESLLGESSRMFAEIPDV